MGKKIGLGVLALLFVFLGLISTREGKFHIERSTIINAPAEKIYPYLSNFRKGSEWSPFEKVDPNMKKKYSEMPDQVGSTLEFEGNSEAGTGKLEFLKLVPNELVQLRLTMTKPLPADNIIQYQLTPEGNGTKFRWSMEGDGGFVGKLMTFFIDCDKMVGDQLNTGFANLKAIVETPQAQ